MLRVVAYVCALLALAHGQTTNVQSCSLSSAPLPINAHIEGCVDPPCILPQGTYAVVNVIFRAPRPIQSMTTVATVHIMGLGIPYGLGEAADTCNYLTNSHCPLDKGEVVQYTLHVFIETFFPAGTNVTVELRVTEGWGLFAPTLWCIRVPLSIVGPLPSSNISAHNATITDKV
ncbi:NPC intracellular cholesterol transporter 2-like [Spodoptera frugiperda]|uniref:NPC intracellular cholesterol transporter 2-like n=1 Tax=Spodoptera frugiperda TaxID=7108 RepID=A0A9R0EPF8_SPOFR|nr:NPC intracellular cholesterol transporter 2-like [Spodoptera frugiperda]